MTAPRFPPPSPVKDVGADVRHRAFVIKDSNGQKLAYVYFSKDEARRSAVNIAKLPALMGR